MAQIVFLLVVVVVIGSVGAVDNYCNENTYNNSEPYMKFTKETNFQEYAVVGMFKALHCCATGYKAIEWYKNDNVYPWPSKTSQLILVPEGANQTICATTVREEDTGNYTCVLRNDTTVIRHTISLIVYAKIPDEPQITYISEDKEIGLGQELRLFCEAFAGSVNLPDATSEAIWLRENYNGSFDNDTRIMQKKSSRENHQTFGNYLVIEKVTRKDFGQYSCRVSYAGSIKQVDLHVREKIEVIYADPNPIPVAKLILFISCVCFLLIVLVIFNLRYGLALRVRFKDHFGPLEEDPGKTSDLMIVYSDKDAELALGVLLPTLETRYNYKCASRELPGAMNLWYSNLQVPAQNTKRLVALLSPAALSENWDNEHLLHGLKQLQSVGPPLCVVTLKELPTKGMMMELKNAQGETLTSLARSLNVVQWERNNDDRFWLSVRLMLPPNRQLETVAIAAAIKAPAPRLNSDSRESLDNLV